MVRAFYCAGTSGSTPLVTGGKTGCAQTGTTSELNLSDYFRAKGMALKVLAQAAEESLKAYDGSRM